MPQMSYGMMAPAFAGLSYSVMKRIVLRQLTEYITSIDASLGGAHVIGNIERVAALMGGQKVLGRAIDSVGDMRAAVENGLPKAVLKNVVVSLLRDPRAQRVLMHKLVPEPTLRRRKSRLNLVESERTERLARITALAQEVWGEEDARAFMTAPHPMLGGRTPAEHIVTDLGAREVEQILHALAFGLPV